MDKEDKTCRSRRRARADDRNRHRLYELAEQALESLVEEGQMEKRFCPEDGKTYYRLRSGCGIQEATAHSVENGGVKIVPESWTQTVGPPCSVKTNNETKMGGDRDYDRVMSERLTKILDEAENEQQAEAMLKSLPLTQEEVKKNLYESRLLRHFEGQFENGVSPQELMRKWPSCAKLTYEYFRKEIRLADQQRLIKRIRTAFHERDELELERCLGEFGALAKAFYDDACGCESGYGYGDKDDPGDNDDDGDGGDDRLYRPRGPFLVKPHKRPLAG
jgi:hypothetical protein